MSDLVDDMIGDGYYATHAEFLEAHGVKMPIAKDKLTELGEALGATPNEEHHVQVRFNPRTFHVFGKGFTFLHFTETPAFTPTGGKYVRRTLVVRRKKDGKKFVGNLRKDAKGITTVNLKEYNGPAS